MHSLTFFVIYLLTKLVSLDEIHSKIFSLILCLQLIIAGLDLLDSLNIGYFVTVHRVTTLSTFEIVWNPYYVLLTFIVIGSIHFLIKKLYYEFIFCLLPLMIYFISPNISTSISALLISIIIIKNDGMLNDLVTWFFIIASIFLTIFLIRKIK